MSAEDEHRASAARPEPNVVMAQPATVQDAAADYAERNTLTLPTVASAPHTHGRQS